MTTDIIPTTYDEAMARLKSRVDTMEDRPQQDAAARAIEQAIEDGSMLVCQAGTGTGKANAALIPAILSGERVVYSTATKALQSQLVDKDLPFLQKHLGVEFTYASLKGWSNYACHQRLIEHPNAELAKDVITLLEDESIFGERDDLPRMDNADWARMTITVDDCPGRKMCAFGKECRPGQARNRAAEVQVVVVNHALVAIDAAVRAKTDGAVDLLGEYSTLVLDECHELEEFVSGALETRMSPGALRAFGANLRTFGRTTGFDFDDIVSTFAVQEREFFDGLEVGRLRQSTIIGDIDRYEALLRAWADARDALRDDEIVEWMDGQSKQVTGRWQRLIRQCDNSVEALQEMIMASDDDLVRWVEDSPRGMIVKTVPVSVADWLRKNLWPTPMSTVLLSATVLVDGRADFIAGRLGLDNFTTLDVGTPFDYPNQAMLYIPKHLPEPSGVDKGKWAVMANEEMVRLVNASRGRALLLFTSMTQMRQAFDSIAPRLEYECRMQGDAPNGELMTWFRDEVDSVLFATRSFFTGASFEGETLSLLVIDKLPFPVPSEPIFQARAEAIVKRHGAWADFNQLSVPMMTLPLQQGVGRLIRTKRDRGVMAILDPRVETKGYGKVIQRSLPPARKTNAAADVEAFFS